ncbi:hypothetical protein Tco_0205233 [Tanacetum coccineum]
MVIIKERLKAARDRQKSYADNRRKPLEFEEGDRVLLKVLPWKGAVRFRKKGKLALRYVGPFEILERIGPVAYRLKLPQELSNVHDTFHVSNLNKCLADASLYVSFEEIKIDKTLCFVEEPAEIMDREVKRLKRSMIPIVKVRWNSRRGHEFTWEQEDFMKAKYPNYLLIMLMEVLVKFRDKISLRRGECDNRDLARLCLEIMCAFEKFKGYAYPVLCGNFGSEGYAYPVLCGNFGSEGYAYPVLCGSLDRRGEPSEAKDVNLRGKFLRALHPKWRAKVMEIEESKDLSSLALNELIGNLKVHELVMEKDSEIYKGKKERVKSIALKAKEESSDDETLTSRSDDEEYAMAIRNCKNFFKRKFVRQSCEEKKSFRKRDDKKSKSDRKCFRCGDLNQLIGECPKPHKTNDEMCLMA